MTAFDCAFAHSTNAAGRRHGLVEHLHGTAGRARSFGQAFGQADACYTAGLWHDIGKVSPEFQAYLAACDTPHHAPHGPNHKDAAAVLASRSRGTAHLAPLLLGHHGGIPDLGDASVCVQSAAKRLDVEHALEWARASLPDPVDLTPLSMAPAPDGDILMRLTYSALVDADFLDTEEHFQPERGSARKHGRHDVAELARREEAAYREFRAARGTGSHVDAIRTEVRRAASTAAAWPTGLFRLTVPTGGGKTMSGLAFALQHAETWDLRRVVVAVPFLTITDQTASVYRAMLGTDAVLEHHSGVEPGPDGGPHARLWRRLAAENWDAAVIVTTTVQLFESLFSNRPSHLRKAHRLARSVIILDEAQALPLHVLGVTVDALGALARAAGATIVFCTATQPALEEIDASIRADVREIVPDFEDHFRALRRVSFTVPARAEPWSWERVAAEATASPQALVVVNRRRDALAVLDKMDDHAHHLSTLLCSAHRRAVLDRVRNELVRGDRCHLVATQVVEAGVDLDFPLVLRALAPLDSIIQAAGRCNREGRLSEGRCVVFRAEERDAFGSYRRGVGTLDGMLAEGEVDFGDPGSCTAYYRRLYGAGSALAAAIDPRGLRAQIERAMFDSVASAYRIIEDVTSPVVVLYPPMQRRVERLLAAVAAANDPGRARSLLRCLQPFVVSIRTHDVEAARSRGLIRDRSGVLVWTGDYDMRIGVAQILDGSATTAERGRDDVGGYVV